MYYYIIDNRIHGFPEPLDPELYDHVKLTPEQAAFYELHNCSAQEALNMELIEIPIDELKSELLTENTHNASQLLSMTDYRVIRHYEQIAAGTVRTLSDEEFNALAASRKAIRDLCNEYEIQILNATTKEKLPKILNYDMFNTLINRG